MAFKICVVLTALVVISSAQRPPYAGRRPIGYPTLLPPTAEATNSPDLQNRFQEDNTPSPTTMRPLPVEALGDRRLVEFLSKLPVEQQPFWFVNWQHLEANRQNPQNYDQKPNFFLPGNIDTTHWV